MPPAPPSPELLRPSVPHVPLTPMMDFFSRRLEALEREITIEREKARSAQSQIQQQEALRGDVESHLKAVSEQLRREKAERETDEMKSHARGRIDALEKRLDEMHQSWVTLLKDAVTSRETGSKDIAVSQQGLAKEQSALTQEQFQLKTEVAGLTAALSNLMEQIALWRLETQSFTKVLPELKSLTSALPEGSRRLEGEVSTMLSQFSSDLRDRMTAWQRHQEVEAERQAERLRQISVERESLQRAWGEDNHQFRQELLRERAAREAELEKRIEGLGQRFSDVILSQQTTTTDTGRIREDLSKAISMLTTPPKAKDQVIAGLELERDDLLKALDDRTRDLQKYLGERRHIEKTMGDALGAMHAEADTEREKLRQLAARFTDLEFENAKLKDQISLHGRNLIEKDERFAAMSAERDGLAKALITEAQKVRMYIEERSLSEEGWRAKFSQMEQRITAEIELRAKESTAASELRSQLSTLTEHMTKAIHEKDAISGRFVDWDNERQKLIAAISQKEEMISMLNAAFQNMLKKT